MRGVIYGANLEIGTTTFRSEHKSKILHLGLPANTKMESIVGNFEIPERGIHLVKLELFTYNNAPRY